MLECLTATEANLSIRFGIGGLVVAVEGVDPALRVRTSGPMTRFAVADGKPDIVLTARRGGIVASDPGRLVFDAGELWRLYRSGNESIFRFYVPEHGERAVQEAVIPGDFSAGEVVYEEELFPPGSPVTPFGHPLDELLLASHLARRGGALVHACGIHQAELGGMLFCGFSGAGKTTTARLWAGRPGVTIPSDDRIVVRTGGGAVRMYGTPWHGEAALSEPFNCPLSAIFVLAHGPANRLTRLSPGDAVAALVARGFPPYYSATSMLGVLTTLAEVVSVIPCFGFEFTPDQSAVDFVVRELPEAARG